jgi:hypothetical protein
VQAMRHDANLLVLEALVTRAGDDVVAEEF